MKQLSYLMSVDEIVKELNISKGSAYKLIREMNKELEDLGYITISGKVPRSYFGVRFFGSDTESFEKEK